MNRLVRRVLLGTLLGVFVLGAFAVYEGLRKIGASLAVFNYWALAGALGLASLNYLIRFLKWQYYLARLQVRGVPVIDSLLVFLSGFVLTITPGKVGEVFKSAVLAKTHGVPAARTAPIVIADRLTDVIGVVALILVGSVSFEGGLSWALAGALGVAVGLLLILWPAPGRFLVRYLEARPGRLAAFAPKLSEGLRSLRILATPSALVLPTLLSIVAWGCEGLALFVLLRGFAYKVPLGLAVFFYSTATLAGALVPLPGGLGIVEGMLRGELVHFGGVSEGAATASMMLVRLATLWWAVAVGFVALSLLRLRFPAALKGDGVVAGVAGAESRPPGAGARTSPLPGRAPPH